MVGFRVDVDLLFCFIFTLYKKNIFSYALANFRNLSQKKEQEVYPLHIKTPPKDLSELLLKGT